MSSNFDIQTVKQTLEVVRIVEQAARHADAVIELTKDLRQQLRQDLDHETPSPLMRLGQVSPPADVDSNGGA
jgi:hypothetical protein